MERTAESGPSSPGMLNPNAGVSAEVLNGAKAIPKASTPAKSGPQPAEGMGRWCIVEVLAYWKGNSTRGLVGIAPNTAVPAQNKGPL
jgi:hypothetical protein